MSAVATLSDAEAVEIARPHLEGVRVSGNQLSSLCPVHRTEHPSQRPFSLELSTGRCHCWSPKCGWTGNAQMLIKELGWTQARSPERRTVTWNLPLSQCGITVDDYGVRFRVLDHEGNRCRDHVRRHEGEPRFNYAGEGRTYHAWVAWELVREWGRGCGIAYVVEGDRDALTLTAHGYPAIGILGIDHFDYARRDIAQPLREMGIGALVLTPDNDEAGIGAVSKWAEALETDGFAVGVRTLPVSIKGAPVKDTFDAYSADRTGFEGLMLDLPVHWRA